MLRIVFVVLSLSMLPTAAHALVGSWGFENLSANNTTNATIGESQLSVRVSDAAAGLGAASGEILFEFFNIGPDAASITDVYFDDRTPLFDSNLLRIIDSDPGVSFTQGASPGNLPSGNTASPPFVATGNLTADSDSPAQPNGVNPGETLGLALSIVNGTSFVDVFNAFDSGALRIGLHVQGFANGGSESFINLPGPGGTIPELSEPTTWLLVAIGLLGLRYRRGRARPTPV